MLARRLSPTRVHAPTNRRPRRDARASIADGVGRRLGKFLASGLVAGLALFHGQLLWQRIASFTLFEPGVALRWSATVLLLGGFIALQRAGISVIWGHRALILWLLVLLCHAGTVAPVEGHQLLAEPGLLLAMGQWTFALLTILGESDRVARGAAPVFARALRMSRPPGLPRESGCVEPFSPRPPPAG